MEVIEVGKFRKTPDDFVCKTQPFCIAFVYAKQGNFIVKGMSKEVETYIAQKFPYCFYNRTLWKDGKSRSHWATPRGLQLWITTRLIDERRKHVVSMATEKGFQEGILIFRNMPKKWLPIFDNAIFKQRVA